MSGSRTDQDDISSPLGAKSSAPVRSGFACLYDKIGRWDLFFLGMLVILGMKVNWGVGLVHDVTFADETFYLWHGVALDLPAASMSPLYSIWYYLLSLLEPDRLDLYFLNWLLLPLMMAVSVYLLIRTLGGAGVLAFMSAAVVLLSRVSDVTPRPMHFAVSLLFVGLSIAFAFRSLVIRLAVATLTVGVASFARPEFAVSFIVLMAVLAATLIWKAYRQPRKTARLATLGVFALLPVFQLHQVLGDPLGEGRSDIAFAQHYAYNKFKAGLREEGARPWHDYRKVVEKDFGDARIDMIGALRAAPGKFAWHVSQNAAWLFTTFHDVLVSPSDTVTCVLWGYVALLVLAALAIAAVRLRRAALRRVAAHAGLPALIALIVIAPVLAGCLLIHPREHYLVCLLGILLVGTSALVGTVSHGWRPENWGTAGGIAAALIVFYAPNHNVGWDYHKLVSASDRAQWSRERTIYNTAELIRQTPFTKEIHALELAFSCFVYGGHDFKTFKPNKIGPRGFDSFLKREDINTVVLSPQDFHSVHLRGDPEYRNFRNNLPPGWVVIGQPGVPTRLAVRRDVLDSEHIKGLIATPLRDPRWR